MTSRHQDGQSLNSSTSGAPVRAIYARPRGQYRAEKSEYPGLRGGLREGGEDCEFLFEAFEERDRRELLFRDVVIFRTLRKIERDPLIHSRLRISRI